MPRRSKIDALPPDILDELNAHLIASGFSGYDKWTAWLKSLGHDVSRSSLHRHGSSLEAEFEEAMADARRTRALAKAAHEAGDEDDGAMLSAASSIMQDSLLRVSLKMKNSGDDPASTAKVLSLVSRAFADVGRFDISRQKWQAEVRAKAALVADSVEAVAKKGGLSEEMLDTIRRDILGIAS